MPGKRKAPSPERLELALRYDARLTAVTRALDNLQRVERATNALASGALEAFPLPGLRLSGDDADLALPLTPQAVDAITRRATTSTVDSALVVQSHELEVRNPRWSGFLSKILGSIRAPMGMTEEAQLRATLKQLVLVRTGSPLPLASEDSEEARKLGRFGSLVVVLPGAFTGGEVTVTMGAESSEAQGRTEQWNPERTERDVYDIAYAALYSDAKIIKAAPVRSGHALCLVYDLVTTTMQELLRFAGAQVLKDHVQTALSNFFFSVPAPLMKRTKITHDAWRTINDFTTDHRLIFPVMARALDELQSNESQLFEHLATFCANSNGQYALYWAALGGCSWDSSRSKDTVYQFSLRAPWIRQGDGAELPFATATIEPSLELGPAGFMERVHYRTIQGNYRRAADKDDPESIYDPIHCFFYVRGDTVCTLQQKSALVVQPMTLEDVLWAEIPREKLLTRLDELVTTSPTYAARIARRFLATQTDWATSDDDFAEFVEHTMTLNDAPLFCDLLRATTDFTFDEDVLPRTIRYFAWDSCVETIEECIETAASFRSSVNLICSALHDCASPDRIDRLMNKLKPLLPWAGHTTLDCTVDSDTDSSEEDPTKEEFSRLLGLAYRSSPTTLGALLEEVNASSLTFEIAIPSLLQVVEGLSAEKREPLAPTLRSLCTMIESSLPVLRNAHYARHTIHEHCDKCSEIQSFLVSVAEDISLPIKNSAQRKHVETVIKRQVDINQVTVETTSPTTVRLTKVNPTNVFVERAERALDLLTASINNEASPPAARLQRPKSKRRSRRTG